MSVPLPYAWLVVIIATWLWNMMLLQMKSSTLPRRPFTHTINSAPCKDSIVAFLETIRHNMS